MSCCGDLAKYMSHSRADRRGGRGVVDFEKHVAEIKKSFHVTDIMGII